MKPSSFEYFARRSLDEAVHNLTSYAGAAKILAGGQSLVPLMNLRLAAPDVLININGLEELGGRRAWDGGLSVGALVRQSTLERADLVWQRLPLLAEANGGAGDPTREPRFQLHPDHLAVLTDHARRYYSHWTRATADWGRVQRHS